MVEFQDPSVEKAPTKKLPPMPYTDKMALGLGKSQWIAARYAQSPPALDPATTIDSLSSSKLTSNASSLEFGSG